ncbi:MAG: phosphodiester glycosidase family protein [Bacilli bacterium]|nr:phosphodiester glycosidase family protein [Bacilli bacterium]
MKKNKSIIIYGFLLISFTVYLLCDTFLISEVYQVVENKDNTVNNQQNSSSKRKPKKSKENENSSQSSSDETNVKKELTDTSYKDNNIEINIQEITEYNTSIYIADIKLSDASYLKTAFAKSSYGKNVTDYTSSTAKSVNAILAINGDYYGVQETGYVLKNGVVYRSTASNREDLVIYKDGSFECFNESDITTQELIEKGAYNVLSFGPALVKNGQISVGATDEVGKSMASNPRTAIGIIDKNHYVFVVSDGRTNESEGLSLYELATIMQNLGCKIAYNLDGGGSSTMYFNGNIINNPTTNGNISERKVSDIVYIGTK